MTSLCLHIIGFLIALTDLQLFVDLYGFVTKVYTHFNIINQAAFEQQWNDRE